MKKTDIFRDFENAPDDVVDGIARACVPLTDKEERRIIAAMERKIKREHFDYEDYVSGVERYVKPPVYKRFLTSAAAAVLVFGVVYGSYSLAKGGLPAGNDSDISSGKVVDHGYKQGVYTVSGDELPLTEPEFYDTGFYSLSNGGVYTVSGDHKRTMYIDYDTMQQSVLCAQPECTHNSSECISRIADHPVICGRNVYFFISIVVTQESADGKKKTQTSSLIKASLDSAEVGEVCRFNNAVPLNGSNFVVAGSKLYFCANDPFRYESSEESSGDWSYSESGGYDFLCSVDLETGEYKNYGIICGDKSRLSGSSFITGTSDGKIYISYAYVDDTSRAIDETSEITYDSYEFDIETEILAESSLPALMCVSENVFAWLEEDTFRLHILKAGKEYTFDCENYSNYGTIINNKLFVNGNWIDLNDMTMHRFGKNKTVVAYYKGCYITKEFSQFEKLTDAQLLAFDLEG